MRQKITCFILLMLISQSISIVSSNTSTNYVKDNDIILKATELDEIQSITNSKELELDSKYSLNVVEPIPMSRKNSDIIPASIGVNDFVSIWNTSLIGSFYKDNSSIKLPLVSGGTYDFNVYWGDGTSDHITSYADSKTNHTYATPGVYTVNN